MNAETFRSDIPLSSAVAAHYGTSWVPEKRGQSEQSEYADTLAADYQQFLAAAQRGQTLDLVDGEFVRYRAGYRKRYLAYLHSRSRCVSTFIAGPSNFPARRMNKRADIAHKRLDELLEFRARAKRVILRTLRPDLAPIMSSDADALDRLEAKIAKAENLQQRMRAANKVVKKKKLTDEQKIVALVAQGFAESIARELLKPDFAGRTGFADYQLSNNNANIRRMKQRVEEITERRQINDSEIANDETGIRFEDAPSDNRVRLYFPDKPAAEIRARLKAHAFRWTPSLGCWQAFRNYRATEFAKKFVEENAS